MEVYSAAWYQSMHFDDIKVVSAADDVEFNVDAEIKNTIEDRDEIWPGDILDYTLTSSGGTIDNDKTEVSFASVSYTHLLQEHVLVFCLMIL